MSLILGAKPTVQTPAATAPAGFAFPQPNILLTGESSTGKTYSFRNMDWTKTAFIDTEVKGFPFPAPDALKQNYFPIEDWQQFMPVLKEIRARTDIRYVIIDGFTDYNTKAMIYERKVCGKEKDGSYTAYRNNSMHIFDFLQACKSKTQITIVTALPEILAGVDDSGKSQMLTRRAKVSGREMEGMIEPAFVYAFCTKLFAGRPPAEAYMLQTQADAMNLAKSPAGAFKDMFIPNDMAKVIAQIEARI